MAIVGMAVVLVVPVIMVVMGVTAAVMAATEVKLPRSKTHMCHHRWGKQSSSHKSLERSDGVSGARRALPRDPQWQLCWQSRS